MKLESLIPEVNILCVNLQDFLKNGAFLFQEYAFSLTSKFWSANFGFPLNSKKFATYPLLIRKVRKIVPPLLQGDEGMIEGVGGTSIGAGREVAYV